MELENLLNKIRSYYSQDLPLSLIKEAYEFANIIYKDKTCISGESYLNHNLSVAEILADLKLDIVSIIAGLLNKAIECNVKIEEIESKFGADVLSLILSITELNDINLGKPYNTPSQQESYRKLVLAIAKDVRVILIELADKLHTLRKLENLPCEIQQDISREIQNIYAPLAHRLGIQTIKIELEDLSFKYLCPDAYNELKNLVIKKREERKAYVEEVKELLLEKLKENNIEGKISGRPKHFYSIYRKMVKQNISFNEIYDLIGFRVIVKTIQDCYAVLGIIHSSWVPIPNRFKDYIAVPKGNMYRSLHTAVMGPYAEIIEIQIRTEEMHEIAEYGIAAHWSYKVGGGVSENDINKFAWLRRVYEVQKEGKDPKEFVELFKLDLFEDEVHVFTPKGEIKSFPKGATPLDYAYSIHTDLGQRCIGAVVDGRIVPLKYQLQNGERVEILTSKNQSPTKDWLNIVKTSKARSKIRSYLKQKEKEEQEIVGKELLEKELKKYKLSLNKILKDEKFLEFLKKHSYKNYEQLFAEIGYGNVKPSTIVSLFLPSENIEEIKDEKEELEKFIKSSSKKDGDIIRICGMKNVLIKFAKCCNPLYGESIIGFITRGKGVTIHRDICKEIFRYNPERKVKVEWNPLIKPQTRSVKLKVITLNSSGMLSAVSKVIGENDAGISRANNIVTKNNEVIHLLDVEITDLDHLTRIKKGLRKIKGVIEVERV